MENDKIDFEKRDVMQKIYDMLQNNQSITINAGDLLKKVALNSDKSVEMITEVLKTYLKVLIYSEQDSPEYDEQTSFFMFSHLDDLDRFELTYSKDNNGKTSVSIGLLAQKPQKTLYS